MEREARRAEDCRVETVVSKILPPMLSLIRWLGLNSGEDEAETLVSIEKFAKNFTNKIKSTRFNDFDFLTF